MAVQAGNSTPERSELGCRGTDPVPHVVNRTGILWNAPFASAIQIRIDSPSGPLSGAGSNAGLVMTGPWVTDGMTFYLQDNTGGNPTSAAKTLATVTVHLTTKGLMIRVTGGSGYWPLSVGRDDLVLTNASGLTCGARFEEGPAFAGFWSFGERDRAAFRIRPLHIRVFLSKGHVLFVLLRRPVPANVQLFFQHQPLLDYRNLLDDGKNDRISFAPNRRRRVNGLVDQDAPDLGAFPRQRHGDGLLVLHGPFPDTHLAGGGFSLSNVQLFRDHRNHGLVSGPGPEVAESAGMVGMDVPCSIGLAHQR